MLFSYALALPALSLLASASCSSTPLQSRETFSPRAFGGRNSTDAVADPRLTGAHGAAPPTTSMDVEAVLLIEPDNSTSSIEIPTAVALSTEPYHSQTDPMVVEAVLIEDPPTTNSVEELHPQCTVTSFDNGAQGGLEKGPDHKTFSGSAQIEKGRVYGQLPSGRICGNLALIDAAVYGDADDVLSVLKSFNRQHFGGTVALIAVSEAIVRGKTESAKNILNGLQITPYCRRVALQAAMKYENDACRGLLLSAPLDLVSEDLREDYLKLVIKYGSPDHVKALIKNNPEFSQEQKIQAQEFIFSYAHAKADDSRAKARSEDQTRCGGDHYLPNWQCSVYFKGREYVPEKRLSTNNNSEKKLCYILLDAAFSEEKSGLLKSFLESDFEFTFDPQMKYLALVNAAARGYLETVASIVKHGVEPDHLDHALGMTNRNKHPEVFNFLIEAIEDKKTQTKLK